MIRKYSEGMGGVDVLDRMLVSYRPRLRSKKWWWNLFSNGLNMAVVAAFRFYQYLYPGDGTTHLNFRRNVAASLLKARPHRQRLGGPTAPVPGSIRLDGVNHFLKTYQQGRCVVCQSNTRLHCIKCRKCLHKLCSEMYHAKQWLECAVQQHSYLFDSGIFLNVVTLRNKFHTCFDTGLLFILKCLQNIYVHGFLHLVHA